LSGVDEQSPLINFSPLLSSPVGFSDKAIESSSIAASSTLTEIKQQNTDNCPPHPFLAPSGSASISTSTPTPSLPTTAQSRKRSMLTQRSKQPSTRVTPLQMNLKQQGVKQEERIESHRKEDTCNEQGEAAVDVYTNHPGMPPPARRGHSNCANGAAVDEDNASQCDEPPVKTRSIKKSEIRDGDILSHRGVASSMRKGNVRFRELVIENKPAYDANSSLDYRTALAKKIVDELRPGRFLKLDDTGTYRVVDYQSSITKALFAMRDCKKKPPKKKNTKIVEDLAQHVEQLPRKRNREESYPSVSSKCSRLAEPTLKRTQPKRKAVTPPSKAPLPPHLTEAESRKIRSLISETVKDISPSSTIIIPTNATTRSEEIHAYIETMVKKGFDARRESVDFIDEEWFHPEMQKCIRVQILQRCKIAMNSTGMTHTEFFDRLFRLEIFP